MTRVALVGTGNIADVHAAALRAIAGVDLAAVVDVVAPRAAKFARDRGIERVFASIDELVAAKAVDAAHVLVPPPLHRPVAEALLRAGIHVFLEKPMATSREECEALVRAAAEAGAALQINHNFVFHPAHLAAKRILASGAFGRVRHVMCHFNMPLRQLASRQLSHWMFDEPKNLLLEQVVHPLSQIDDLIGPARESSVLAAPPTILGDGQEVHQSWDIALRGERATAQLHVGLGQSFPAWSTIIICDDGRLTVDYVNNRVTREAGTKWPDFYDSFLTGVAAGASVAGQSLRNLVDHGLSLLKLRPRSDPFFSSIKGSVAAFYATLERDRKSLNGAPGRRVAELCIDIAAAAPARKAPAANPAAPDPNRQFDVAVLGGTGFIGVHLLAHLLRAGKSVAVLARSPRNLPGIYNDPRVGVFRGDVTKREDVVKAIGRSRLVVNLAHGGGGSSWEEIQRALVGSAVTVAECCLSAGVDRLVHVSTIAALYLGGDGPITGATPVDPRHEQRGDYARAKAEAEQALLALHRGRGLPVCILRPGVVTGAGGLPFHSGIGFYNRDSRCLGWNDGRNPLPLVLVEDVADAIVKALDAKPAIGRCYNIVGDVRLTAREYIAELARATGRPLSFQPQSPEKLFAIEFLKWSVKRATGRRNAVLISLRDLRSRGLPAQFDCSDAKRDLGWQPVSDRERFLRDGIAVYAQ